MTTLLTILVVLGLVTAAALFAWGKVRAHVTRKAQLYEERVSRAEFEHRCGRHHIPEKFYDSNAREEFFHGVRRHALRHGAPEELVNVVLEKTYDYIKLCNFAGALEKEGLSWIEQQVAVGDRIVLLWEKRQRLEQKWGWIFEDYINEGRK